MTFVFIQLNLYETDLHLTPFVFPIFLGYWLTLILDYG